jgi:hypothetical protein
MDEYPSGQPLYFTLYVENTSGARIQTTCMLPTYDTTPPTGRIYVDFLSTSNPAVLKASLKVNDDSPITRAVVAVGYAKGIYGDQIKHWTEIDLDKHDNSVFGNKSLST